MKNDCDQSNVYPHLQSKGVHLSKQQFLGVRKFKKFENHWPRATFCSGRLLALQCPHYCSSLLPRQSPLLWKCHQTSHSWKATEAPWFCGLHKMAPQAEFSLWAIAYHPMTRARKVSCHSGNRACFNAIYTSSPPTHSLLPILRQYATFQLSDNVSGVSKWIVAPFIRLYTYK